MSIFHSWPSHDYTPLPDGCVSLDLYRDLKYQTVVLTGESLTGVTYNLHLRFDQMEEYIVTVPKESLMEFLWHLIQKLGCIIRFYGPLLAVGGPRHGEYLQGTKEQKVINIYNHSFEGLFDITKEKLPPSTFQSSYSRETIFKEEMKKNGLIGVVKHRLELWAHDSVPTDSLVSMFTMMGKEEEGLLDHPYYKHFFY